ncbi:MAG: hypothetical protein IPM54_13475 [Polyangiaceae bacterium]|nr:hypothetical protein [Polyangiaceae bacterium]
MSTIADLFNLVVPREKAHPNFLIVKEFGDHIGARFLMNHFFSEMGDPNGNFRKDFQTGGYYGRVFEIACYAALRAYGLEIDHSFEQPDFIVSDGSVRVAIEVATTNPVDRVATDVTARALQMIPIDELADKCQEDLPIRIGRLLNNKLQKQYWQLPQCKDLPFVLMVGPFHEAGSNFYVDDSVARYLYGIDVFPDWIARNGLWVRSAPIKEHHYDGKSWPSNFFSYPMAEHISAVMYCNAFTMSKFVRMSMIEGLAPPYLAAVRKGTGFFVDDADDVGMVEFDFDVGDPDVPCETWWEGSTIIMNPKARVPLPDDALPCSSILRLVNERIIRTVYGFHPLVSATHFGRRDGSTTVDSSDQPE